MFRKVEDRDFRGPRDIIPNALCLQQVLNDLCVPCPLMSMPHSIKLNDTRKRRQVQGGVSQGVTDIELRFRTESKQLQCISLRRLPDKVQTSQKNLFDAFHVAFEGRRQQRVPPWMPRITLAESPTPLDRSLSSSGPGE
eukprot:760523-Hanusia_phi.AAC.5